ncbi:MAG: phenylalanine--tRNA ligase subunit beta [Planctomycetales bacterium]|nr:phenylalanine--tRNA ligase subunit beta [Planctomycetales bacterium]
MIVSWNWLKEYVPLTMSPDELAHRLAMSGLNHESTTAVGNDFAIDLEVTSNRGDCLGHIGVAREVSVLWQQPLSVPAIALPTGKTPVSQLTQVRIDCPELCPRYTARVIRGVKIGPSPAWLADRLRAVGIAVISNIVDITNYVLMECGQPLHAFDFDKLTGQQIIVRAAQQNEEFVAIDHRAYTLTRDMCVIADAERPVALGGVMGGATSEVSDTTTSVLLEAAEFAPLSIRGTARSLRLHSPSSYRFERGVDPVALEWASRRACQLILELAGGELAEGVIDVQPKQPAPPQPVVLRYSQIKRILGIELEQDRVLRILQDLGMKLDSKTDQTATWISPSWRRDLSREIDLIEEVARINGYDQIPEDVGVPMAPSSRPDRHRVLSRVRDTLTASGFHEAMTVSVVDEKSSSCFSPWSDAAPIRTSMPMLRGADCLRRSLVPSLLESRRVNESLANDTIELFETAKVYLPTTAGLPEEQWILSLTSGRDFRTVKGTLEAMLEALHVTAELKAEPYSHDFLDPSCACRLLLGGELLGFLGGVSKSGRKQIGLRRETIVAELKLAVLTQFSQLIPQHHPLSPYPAIDFDFNFIVAERVRWDALAATVTQAAGSLLENIAYQETYRDAEKDGKDRKRLLFSVRLRSTDQTLTGDQADEVHRAIITACQEQHQAELLG